jgi:drug/metabolite transporter (DMT)-like permease
MNYLPLSILFISGIVLTIGDLIFKSWAVKGMGYSLLYVFGVITYLAGSLLLVESYKYDVNIVVAGIIQILLNTVILVVFTYFYFHEPLTAKQIVGIILAVVSLYLIK